MLVASLASDLGVFGLFSAWIYFERRDNERLWLIVFKLFRMDNERSEKDPDM